MKKVRDWVVYNGLGDNQRFVVALEGTIHEVIDHCKQHFPYLIQAANSYEPAPRHLKRTEVLRKTEGMIFRRHRTAA